MGIGATIHGIIDAPAVFKRGLFEPDDLRVYRHNRAIIRNLPERDPDYLITRAMFAFPPYRKRQGAMAPAYDRAPIHFAGNYKEMLLLPDRWIHKFEQLLANLFWESAVVYNEFAGLRYTWKPLDGFSHDPRVQTKFALTCWILKGMEELPVADAIYGEYVHAEFPQTSLRDTS